MLIGVIRAELRIHGCQSLKEKRAVLRRIKDRTRSRHNISVAEVDHQGLHQRSVLAFAAVGHSEDDIRRLFRSLRDEVDAILPGGVTDWEEDMLE